ncbi:MAG TPA: PLP-dependent aminotransferase family protein [Holophagaceae bacterium]
MRANELMISLPPAGQGPLYLQVARSIQEAIESRRIAAGMALPGVRDLAERLGVTVNTVLAALRELQAQNWVESRERVGFFVASTLPTPRAPDPLGPGTGSTVGFELPAHVEPISSVAHAVLDLTDGLPDARLAPAQALGRAYQRALKLRGPELLGASDPKGHPRLREALASLLRTQRALRADPDQLLVLGSTILAVNLVAQAFLGPEGGTVAVETPGNPAIWQALRQTSRAELRPIQVDEGGARVKDLEALVRTSESPVRLLVLTPQSHFPTGARLADPRRPAILELARRHRIPILELDAEYDFLLDQSPAPRALAVDAPEQVVYVGDLARLLAPGVRAAYLVAPKPLLPVLANARRHLDWQGDPLQEWALSELLLDGEILRQMLRVRKAARERRDAVEDALRHALDGRLAVRSGGTALWLQGVGAFEDPERFATWIRGCQSRGLKLRPGSYYQLNPQPLAGTRMGFTAHTPEELQAAVALMS